MHMHMHSYNCHWTEMYKCLLNSFHYLNLLIVSLAVIEWLTPFTIFLSNPQRNVRCYFLVRQENDIRRSPFLLRMPCLHALCMNESYYFITENIDVNISSLTRDHFLWNLMILNFIKLKNQTIIIGLAILEKKYLYLDIYREFILLNYYKIHTFYTWLSLFNTYLVNSSSTTPTLILPYIWLISTCQSSYLQYPQHYLFLLASISNSSKSALPPIFKIINDYNYFWNK